jgi:hypothetical protein
MENTRWHSMSVLVGNRSISVGSLNYCMGNAAGPWDMYQYCVYYSISVMNVLSFFGIVGIDTQRDSSVSDPPPTFDRFLLERDKYDSKSELRVRIRIIRETSAVRYGTGTRSQLY